MKNYPNWPCECRNWCRCEPIDLTKPIANHHHACEHYEASKIDVWRVTLDGASYVTDREPTPEEINEGEVVTKAKMAPECYEQPAEFAGF